MSAECPCLQCDFWVVRVIYGEFRMRLATELATGLADLLYPPVCLACDRLSRCLLCADCSAQITRDPFPTCPRCGSTVGPHSQIADRCPRCRDEPYSFAGVFR